MNHKRLDDAVQLGDLCITLVESFLYTCSSDVLTPLDLREITVGLDSVRKGWEHLSIVNERTRSISEN